MDWPKILKVERIDTSKKQQRLTSVINCMNMYKTMYLFIHYLAQRNTSGISTYKKTASGDFGRLEPCSQTNIGEYNHLIKQIKSLGYAQVTASGWERQGEPFRFDLFRGNFIHTTELLQSPLEDKQHTCLMEFSRLYIGVLNEYDLIVSKLMRGTQVDYDDCLMLTRAHREKLDIDHLVEHYRELVSYDISEQRIGPHIDRFIEVLKENDLYG